MLLAGLELRRPGPRPHPERSAAATLAPPVADGQYWAWRSWSASYCAPRPWRPGAARARRAGLQLARGIPQTLPTEERRPGAPARRALGAELGAPPGRTTTAALDGAWGRPTSGSTAGARVGTTRPRPSARTRRPRRSKTSSPPASAARSSAASHGRGAAAWASSPAAGRLRAARRGRRAPGPRPGARLPAGAPASSLIGLA